MYCYDEDALQPENGNKARYDPAAAIEQRNRWVAAALEGLELEANSERYADDLFPEPYPSDPDEEKPFGSFSYLSETWVPASAMPEATPRPDTPDNFKAISASACSRSFRRWRSVSGRCELPRRRALARERLALRVHRRER
eukprot:5528015-Pleurochrysis_carterae.AAC.1